jgi:hypothetical protein
VTVVYYSHSYRDVDARFVGYFADLLRREGFIISLDPPSKSVNASKLQRHLRSSDAMVAVLSWREPAVSQHILFEIGMCLQSRKPLLVFVEDVLVDGIVPRCIYQQRFSRRSYIRQIREHRHALRALKTFVGDDPVPRYQPGPGQRSCLVVGFEELPPPVAESFRASLEGRGFRCVEVVPRHPSPVQSNLLYESLQCADLAVMLRSSRSPAAAYLSGALMGYFVPTIEVTLDADFTPDAGIAPEYQARAIPRDAETAQAVLASELKLFEEDFLDLEEQAEVQRYLDELLALGSRAGYGADTRNRIMQEVVMGDQYRIEGQAGAVGPGAIAVGNEFVQLWNSGGHDVDLDALAAELAQLRAALKSEGTRPEHDLAVAEVAQAEIAAGRADGPGALQHLKAAGRWALDVAETIGVAVATAALKTALKV